MSPEQETRILIAEGLAHESRKAAEAMLKLALSQEARAFDLRHGEGESQRIKTNEEVWK